MKRKTLLLSLILVVGAALSLLLMLHGAKNKPVNKMHKQLDAYMNNAHFTEYNQQGQVHSTLASPNVSHYQQNSIAFFNKPNIMFYTQTRIPWHINADHGKTKQGSKQVYLWGHVVIHQPPKKGYPETTIYTTKLTVYPQKSLAKTKQNVTIKRPGTLIKGRGMTANFKTGTYQLLSQSQAFYSPKK